MVDFFKRVQERWTAWRKRRLFPESQVLVALDDGVVRCTWPGQEPASLSLDHLTRVLIKTTDDGPFACDLFWILESRSGTPLTIPKGATGEDDLVAYLVELDGFDHMRMIVAMGSTSNNLFECWTA